MLAPLLTLPYELREQILTYLLYQEGNISLQYSSKPPDLFTPPVIQVSKLLREEAIGIFYDVNIFEWTIDPEAVSLGF
jgi:predicted HTH domain antitoxin